MSPSNKDMRHGFRTNNNKHLQKREKGTLSLKLSIVHLFSVDILYTACFGGRKKKAHFVAPKVERKRE